MGTVYLFRLAKQGAVSHFEPRGANPCHLYVCKRFRNDIAKATRETARMPHISKV